MGGGVVGGGREVANGFESRVLRLEGGLVFGFSLLRLWGGGQLSSSWQTRGRHVQSSQNRVVAVEDPMRAVRVGGRRVF